MQPPSGLFRQKYIAREGRTECERGKGLRLIELYEEMQIEALTLHDRRLEAKLNKMQHGEIKRGLHAGTTPPKRWLPRPRRTWTKPSIASSRPGNRLPKLGAPRLKQTDATYECRDVDCDFKVSKHIAGRTLSEEEAVKLFTEKELPEMDGFRSRFNKPFEAGLKLARTVSKTGKIGKWKIDFVFDEELEPTEDLRDDQILKELTLKDGTAGKLYATEKGLPPSTTQDQGRARGNFRLGKTLSYKELEPDAVEKLFTEGKTGS